MTEIHTTQDETLSTLMDGELQSTALQSAITSVMSDSKSRSTWHAYHVIGDVLRSEELSGAAQDLQFLARLEARLAHEPLSLTTMEALPLPPPSGRYLQSANGPIFWRALATVACTVLVAVVGFSVLSPGAAPPSGSMASATPSEIQINATQAAPLQVAVSPDGMIRDPRLDQLLSAHQQLGGHSAFQMPSGFLRNATYEGAGR